MAFLKGLGINQAVYWGIAAPDAAFAHGVAFWVLLATALVVSVAASTTYLFRSL